MNDTTLASPPPRKGRGWLRIPAWFAGILIVLLVLVYFVATSSAFFKGVILPQVGKAVNADITVGDASISPFKEVVLRNLKVQTTGTEPLVTAPEVRVRYRLLDILGGNIHVDEVVLSSPTVIVVENPDKTSNLDPLMQSQPGKPNAQPAQPSKPAQLDLGKVTLTDATVRKVKVYQNGNRDTLEVSHLNVTLEDLKNGQTGKLGLDADLKAENHPPAPGVSGLLQAKLKGSFAFTLAADLKPVSIKGNTRLEVSRAEGALAELATLGADLDCEVTPTEIKQVALRFQKSDARLGEVRVSGPFDLEKVEGRLAVAIQSIDKQLLNLAGAKSGIDFGATTLNSTNEIQLAKAGSSITAVGQLNVSRFSVTRTNETTPPLDFLAEYNVTVDRAQSNALLRGLTLTGTQRGSRLLRAELTSPMQIAWGAAASAVGDSTFQFTVTGLNLADWKPFLGHLAAAGTVNAQAKLLSQQGGQQLTFDLGSQIENLTAAVGSNSITQAGVTLKASGKAIGLKQFNLSQCELQVARKTQPLLSVSGSGSYDLEPQSADLQVMAQAALARLLEVVPQPDAVVSSGTAEFKGHITQKQKTQTITGSLTLADFTGRFGKNEFRGLAAKVQMDASLGKQVADVRQFQIALAPTARAKNELQLSGQIDMSQTNAIRGQLKLAADSLDVTSYYDLFAGEKKTSETKPAPGGTRSAPAASSSEKEPAATQLPFRNFTAEVNIRRFYLREVEVADFQTTAKVDGGHVVLNPFKLTLNGAPADLTLDLDLGVPGYKYDAACNAQRIPLAPLMNSFAPERKGQVGGTVTAQARVSGTGVTGASLQRNLTGQFDVSSTNLNLAVANIKSPMLKRLVNVVSLIPELVRNPLSAATQILQGSSGKAGSSGGLADELQKSPVNAILARGKVGSGRVDLQQAVVQSAAFEADAQGTISLAAVLTNSVIQIPVAVSLSRSIAQQMSLVSTNTPTNTAYAKVPDFLKMKGTVGAPEAEINKLALAGTVLKGVGNSIASGGGILQQIGEALTGQAPGATNAATNTNTNQPASKGGGLLQSLGGLLNEGAAGTNKNTPTNTQTNQAATNQSPAGDLINDLFGPKKK